jgi:hypothetical protein
VAPIFNNAPAFKRQDAVSVADRGEPVRDHQCRAPFGEAL